MIELKFKLFDELKFNPRKEGPKGRYYGLLLVFKWKNEETGRSSHLPLWISKNARGEFYFHLPPEDKAMPYRRWLYNLLKEDGELMSILRVWAKRKGGFEAAHSLTKTEYLAYLASKKSRPNITMGTTTQEEKLGA
jgi:hypothetical protein